jgi:methylated-DNA-[protein]-cysteine S-methyltransferase
MELLKESVETPLGKIIIVTHKHWLCSLDFEGYEERLERLLIKRFGACRLLPASRPSEAQSRAISYFQGQLDAFSGISLLMQGSAFQEKVWRALGEIPAGTTCSYKDIAIAIGQPKASRAVGSANARNPIALAVPCHRVIGAGAQLGGYAGGINKKKWLMGHERKWA